jgi:hypothetical protein
MKSFDDRWLVTLKISDDPVKKFKALMNIKKSLKDNHEDFERYKKICNECHHDIFPLLADKLSKYDSLNFVNKTSLKTSALDKLAAKITFSGNILPDLIEILDDVFTYISFENVQKLVKDFRVELFVIIYKFLDHNTKKEIRKLGFTMLLLVIESYAENFVDYEF